MLASVFTLLDIFAECTKLWIKLEKNSSLGQFHSGASGHLQTMLTLPSDVDCDSSTSNFMGNNGMGSTVLCQAGHTCPRHFLGGWRQWLASGRGAGIPCCLSQSRDQNAFLTSLRASGRILHLSSSRPLRVAPSYCSPIIMVHENALLSTCIQEKQDRSRSKVNPSM